MVEALRLLGGRGNPASEGDVSLLRSCYLAKGRVDVSVFSVLHSQSEMLEICVSEVGVTTLPPFCTQEPLSSDCRDCGGFTALGSFYSFALERSGQARVTAVCW